MIALFLFCGGFCVYTLFGYPLLLGLVARCRTRPVRKAPWPATVSVILPVHNGEPWVAGKLESILALNYHAQLLESLVVPHSSTDATKNLGGGFPGRAKIELLAPPRGGKTISSI